MKVQRQSSDRISSLPQDIIEKILTLIPIQDALRTSILSKRWRYCWKGMPKLVFDNNMVNISSESMPFKKYKIVNAIFHVLLLHTGPILELSICIGNIDFANEIDQIIHHLSRSNSIKKFIFESCKNNISRHKLPCLFFSLQGLEHLDLTYCAFELPSMCNGFSMLKSLSFCNVKITVKVLQRFLTNCPLLERFALIGCQKDFTTRRSTCTFVELLKCLPSVQVLQMSKSYIKHFAAGRMPLKLPTLLVHLRILVLTVCLCKQDELSFTLCVINSSPNLQKIHMRMDDNAEQTGPNLIALQDYYSGLNCDHLKKLELIGFHNYAPEMELVKLIMAKSSVLKQARIELNTSVSVDEENKMLRGFLSSSFPRSSPTTNFIIERPKSLALDAN